MIFLLFGLYAATQPHVPIGPEGTTGDVQEQLATDAAMAASDPSLLQRLRRENQAVSEQEALRKKCQFWTPDWVADAMVAFVLGDGARVIFDPAVGNGAFLRAASPNVL